MGGFLRLGCSLPEENLPKDDHLRPRRLRRSSAAHRALSSGQHSLPGVELAGAGSPPMSTSLIEAGVLLL